MTKFHATHSQDNKVSQGYSDDNYVAPHAIIIGSGFGGLSSALRFCAKGYRVTVLERLDRPGGRARSFAQDGCTFDAGPTVVTAPHLLAELFSLVGQRLEDSVKLLPVEPLYTVRFPDGTQLKFSSDPDVMETEVRKTAPEDLPGYRRFMALSESIFQSGFELIDTPFDSLSAMAGVLPTMIRLKSYHTVYGLIARYIRNEKLRQIMSFHTLLVGGNPFTTTSIYCLISYLEQEWGVQFPLGGVGALVHELVNVLERSGGRLITNTTVRRIEIENGRVTGVTTETGETLSADVVVCNSDPSYTYKNMISSKWRRRWTDRRISRARYSMSCFVWYFGTNKRYEDLPQHTILLGPRYKALLDDIFQHKRLADDFSLYLHRSTATDPGLAPPGCDAFYVLAPVPNLSGPDTPDWTSTSEPYRASIARFLEASVLPDLTKHIATSRTLTPLVFRDQLLSYQGAAFGLEPVFKQSAYFRPHNKSEDIDGLFFVGASTHPGAGLPGVISSAKVVDRYIPIAPYFQRRGENRSEKERRNGDIETCQQILKEGSKSFAASALLMPKRLRGPSAAVYAFCRLADDAVDHTDEPAQAVAELSGRLDRIYKGQPEEHPADRAFCDVVHRFEIPRTIPDALIDGFRFDAENRRYQTIADLQDYCARVASTVGVMITLLMGPRSPKVLARACDLGIAMQLTNIARDVGEDARAGRVYLPLNWLDASGLDPDKLIAKPKYSDDLGNIVEKLLDTAQTYYELADIGIRYLPRDCRQAIYSARLIYAAIGQRIRDNHFDTINHRAYTTKPQKIRLILKAQSARFWQQCPNETPPSAAVQFLINAVRGMHGARPMSSKRED